MELVIAEKPSVAQSIAAVLGATQRKDGYLEGNEYLVSWCVGHLVELVQPESYEEAWKKWSYDNLPIIPQEWQHEVKSDTKAQYQILKKLMHDDRVDAVVCATDAGREGELIFRLTYNMAGCRKPMKRLWSFLPLHLPYSSAYFQARKVLSVTASIIFAQAVIMTICTSQHYAGRKQTGLWVSMGQDFLRYYMAVRH